MIVLVSACLAGINCKYSGDNNERARIVEIVQTGSAILVCPEQLGGLSTPRPPADIFGGDGHDVLEDKASVRITESGKDVTDQFLKGAYETLKIAQLVSADVVLLKQRSPSCGCGQIYNRGTIVKGDGVTTALLKQQGFRVEAID